MLVANSGQPVVIVTDWQSRADRDLDLSDRRQAPHVLQFWRMGREALGAGYYRTTRIALFAHGQEPTRREVAHARDDLRNYVNSEMPARLVVIPTPDAQAGEGTSLVAGTVCWAALGAPDSLGAMRLTRWARQELGHTTTVIPLFPIARRVKELQVWAAYRALRRLAEPTLVTRPVTQPGAEALAALGAMRGHNLAVDLEFVPDRDLVTAINLSDGERAVSMPYHAYTPRGHEEAEPALRDYALGHAIYRMMQELLADLGTTKYCHNYVADVPLLRRLGFEVKGTVHDTFAAHAIAFPELGHGLQVAAASMLPVPPWKSLYKPRCAPGVKREDEEYWTADPEALRVYGAQDAFYTWHLAQQVLPWVGFGPPTGDADDTATQTTE